MNPGLLSQAASLPSPPSPAAGFLGREATSSSDSKRNEGTKSGALRLGMGFRALDGNQMEFGFQIPAPLVAWKVFHLFPRGDVSVHLSLLFWGNSCFQKCNNLVSACNAPPEVHWALNLQVEERFAAAQH